MSHTAQRYDFRDKPADYARLALGSGVCGARGGALLGVLDLDSPRAARFDGADARGLESLAELFVRSIRETSALAVGA